MNSRDPLPSSPDAQAMAEWRHAIHRHPELGFEETRTSALVAERLAAWGYEVTSGLAATRSAATVVISVAPRESPKRIRSAVRPPMRCSPSRSTT